MREEPVGILYLIDILYDNAGTENNLFRTVTGLERSRFRPVVAPLQPLESPMIARMRAEGIRVEPLGLNRSWDGGACAAARKMRRIMREEKISLIQSIHLGSDLFAAIWKRLWGNPVWISSRRDMGFTETSPHHLWLRRLMNPAVAQTLTNSQLMRTEISRREHIAPERIRTIYNGVEVPSPADPERKARLARDNGLDPDLPIIGCVANWRPVKGVEYLLQAFARAREKRPEIQLVLIGGDADAQHPEAAGSYRALLEGLIAENGMGERVKRLGRRTDAVELIGMMDLFVLPSLSEGFSNALLEAMAAGLPVIATRVGGNPEAVVHGESGLLVPAADAGALGREMGLLLDDLALRKRLGAAARRRVMENFSTPVMISGLETAYAEALAGVNK
ncbi:MAG TPA: glycosyltransferase [bacterium]|nr:glycosyltransferase [bacterium]